MNLLEEWSGNRGRYNEARRSVREQGRSKAGLALLLHIKMAPMSALGVRGRSIFDVVGKRRRILTVKRVLGDLPEECRFFLNTQLMFLKIQQKWSTMTGGSNL